MTTAGTDLFGWALEAGIAMESILWTCAGAMVVMAWPMSVLLRRG